MTTRPSGLIPKRFVQASQSAPPQAPPEVWAGAECSVVRIGDVYRDQLEETGHVAPGGRLRKGDLAFLARLGVKAVRYPVIWDKLDPDGDGQCDWRSVDARLADMRRLGLKPIVGLVHHGSGPRHTSLLDPAFPEKLAAFAGEVARRYPWITHFTPVNEPLTTARFSCLYGLWHPHRRSERDFLHATVNQCRAVALAMQAIRRETPGAVLVQTEDMGRTFATPRLAAQARLANERRWLSLDLLMGRVTPDHPWHRRLVRHGVPANRLTELADGLGRPDIIGINHYLTSDRYLDENVGRFPHVRPGRKGRIRHVDVEATRAWDRAEDLGFAARLGEVWQRYRHPMAVTEVHNHCTREEQLRWMMDAWQAVVSLRAEGADIRAMTLWSVFGAVDWCSLLTRFNGVRELGLIDLSGPEPRPTLVAKAAHRLARKGRYAHPVLETPGWWRRDDRFVPPRADSALSRLGGPPILITGASGTLGQALARVCQSRGLAHVVTNREMLDICDASSIEQALDKHRPWAVINAAGFVRVSEAERLRERCFVENATGAGLLARACARLGLPFVTFSSDLVFDGKAGRSYVENDRTNPLGVYGKSKRRAELLVSKAHPDGLLIRTSAFFGPWDPHNFIWHTVRQLAQGSPVMPEDRQLVSPTYVPDLAHATLDLMLDGESGIWHLANDGCLSWNELAREVANRAGLDISLVRRPETAAPETNTSLASMKAVLLPPLDTALDAYFRDITVPWAA